jgi:hypothetical protein
MAVQDSHPHGGIEDHQEYQGEIAMQQFLDIDAARLFAECAAKHYEKAPGWLFNWLDEMYIRLGENWGPITLDELATLAKLQDGEYWLAEQYTCNTVYKLLDRLGRDTTGIMGY